LTLNLQTSLQVGGWLSGTDALEITVPAASTIFGIITDVGSSIRQTGATGSLTVTTNRGIRVAGQISTAAAEAAPELTAGTRLDLLAGADVAATGANAVLELSADEALTLHTGSLVRAGMTVDISSGAPVTSVTGVNGQISITTPAEMWLAGLVVSSGGLSLQSGTSDTDYTDLFNDLTDNSASHYLADQASFGLLLTGTILVQGADEELVLASADDVILLGNVTMSGDGADLTVQSDTFVYAEGRLTAADRLRVLGGVALDGTVLGSADRHGSSIYLAATGAVNTTQAGAEINLHGAQDVDIHLPLIAGGTVGATGITWAGDGSEVTVTAGQQIYLDAPIQAAAAIHLHPGTPGADDAGRNFIMSTASGLNAAGLGANNTGSLIRLESPGDLDIPANILSGGTIVQNFGAGGELLSETYTWSGRDSRIEIVAGGKVLVGTDTVDVHGNPVQKGSFLRASSSVSILAGSHASGVGIELYPNGGISTNDADGAILLDTAQSIDLRGQVVSGGQIFLVQNAAGETTGYSVTRHDGTASLEITAGGQVRLGQEVYAGKLLTIEAGTATATPDDPFSLVGLLVMGSSTIRTGGADGRMLLSSRSGISVLTPSVAASDVYGLYASGTGSTITLEVLEGADPASKIYIGNRILAEQAFVVDAESNEFTAESFELDVAGAIEVLSQSISRSGADTMLVKGSLISRDGSVIVESAGSLEVRNQVSAGDEILLRATAGDLTLAATSRIDAAGAVTLDASGSVQLDGPIGSTTAPAALQVTADIAIEASQVTSHLRSSVELSMAAPVVHFGGLLTTTGNTVAASDYEVRISASEELRLTGRFSTAGSVLIDSPNSPLIYNFTATQTGNASRWKIQTTDDLTLGRLVDNGSGQTTAEGVQLQAVSE
ncbi:MAG: beta strand repeat-containing protein, partial [Planctomyces sp.]